MKRRGLLLSGLGAAGALVVGWGLLPPRGRTGSPRVLPAVDGDFALNGWIRIGGDSSIRLAMNRSEMGQGVHTALSMLVAEELDLPLQRINLVDAGADRLYGNVAMFYGDLPFPGSEPEPGREKATTVASRWMVAKVARELGINATGGSSSIVDAWDVLPFAAASARAQLVNAAALKWRLPAPDLVVADGVVSHPSGPRATYGELARLAAATPAGNVARKPRAQWKLVGTAAPRVDAPPKSDGSARFGVDMRLPRMLHAVVRHAPIIGGGVGAVDVAPALRLPGVERVVRLGPYAGSTEALAVVGETYWHALQGARALAPVWQPPPAGALDTRAIEDDLLAVARSAATHHGGHVFRRRGDVAAAERGAYARIERVYRAPYLAHLTMEPINCTACVADGRVEVWAATQVPGLARALAAQVARVPEDAVTVHVTYLGGGFGRRLDVDVVGQAVRIALETGGRPVQLVWPREEDVTHDFYRPAGVAILGAALGKDGMPVALAITSAGDAVTPRWIERALPAFSSRFDLPDKTASEGLFDLPYGVPHQRIAHVATRHRVPVGYWRSVGHSHNAFFCESFIDELALHAERDPVEFRLALLGERPRHRAVLRLAAEKAGWPGFGSARPLPPGHARGIALHESYGSVVAQVVEVSDASGHPRIERIVCAADAGTIVNPDIVAQQLEGGALFGLSAALHGRIEILDGVVQQTNFSDHPVLRMADSAPVEVHLVTSDRAPAGVGEIGVPPAAPALANAWCALTGERRRALPLVG